MLWMLVCLTMFQETQSNPFDENRLNLDQKAVPAARSVKSVPTIPTKNFDAALKLSQAISELAEETNVRVNSISNRKPMDVEGGGQFLRVYMGYDSEVGSLMDFLTALDELNYGISVQTLNMSARRMLKRRTAKQSTSRFPLNGNMIVSAYAQDNAFTEPMEAPNDVGAAWIRDLVTQLGDDLPDHSVLTSVIFKRNSVTVQGKSLDPNSIASILENMQGLADVKPGNVYSNTRDNHDPQGLQRFIYKANLNLD